MNEATLSIGCMVMSTLALFLIMLKDKKKKPVKVWLANSIWTIISYLVVLAIWVATMFYKGVF